EGCARRPRRDPRASGRVRRGPVRCRTPAAAAGAPGRPGGKRREISAAAHRVSASRALPGTRRSRRSRAAGDRALSRGRRPGPVRPRCAARRAPRSRAWRWRSRRSTSRRRGRAARAAAARRAGRGSGSAASALRLWQAGRTLTAQSWTKTRSTALRPSASEWLAFAFIRDAPRMPNGQYLGIETAPVEPWPHQRVVARRLVDGWPLSWMLCDEVGLGKTIEAGLALRALRLSGRVGRVLIAAPASLAPQWQREMADKFLLPFSRALGGATVRHKVLLPRELERPAASLFAPELTIVSTGLLTREERQVDLRSAEGWDVVLIDEAHCARRSNPTAWAQRPPRWTRLYRIARDVLRTRTASLWLATATPMQLEPIEAIDLAGLTRRLGPFGAVPQLALAWYVLLGRLRDGGELEPLEWRFMARAAQHVLRLDPATSGFVERTLLRGGQRRGLLRWLDSGGLDAAAPPAAVRKAAMRLLFAVAPLSRAMLRHDRRLLRKYREQGSLPGGLPSRRVHLPAIRLGADEKAIYALFAPYCRALAAQVGAHARQRIAVGFMLSFFDLRFASSYKAIRDTLERRRERVRAALA